MPLVFVYGSLLSREHNHRVMRGAKPVGNARTQSIYTLVDLGSYPALLDAGDTSVVGELYEVSEAHLARIDDFEGHPHLYERRSIVLEDGATALGYVMRAARAARAPIVQSGDWRKHRQRD